MRPIPSVPGTNDVLPAQSAAWQWLLETHARVAQAHGYQLIDTPVIEYTELFERGRGLTDALHADLRELPVSPLLRPLAAEHRPFVANPHRPALLDEA